jgi:glycosyltransferase involved in cell wall biosynthesis
MSPHFSDPTANHADRVSHRGEVTGAAEAEISVSLRDRTILLDCRYLGLGGTGRVTELLLREFQGDPPPGRWMLWGRPDRIEPLRFPGAGIAATTADPLSLMGQRSIAAIPAADVVIYMHQIRPLRPGPSVTVIHDTIPVRYGGGRLSRTLKRSFFRLAARLSGHVLTDSQFSKDSIHRDLSVPLDRITVMRFAVDEERAKRIWQQRQTAEQQKLLLYVGRFDRHKNLRRLCIAFGRSRFAAEGGRLLLVGGWDGEVEGVRRWVREAGVEATEVRGRCSEEELDQLLASSRALIMPSLEEGYGLPAFEAAATGLPVAVTRTGAMDELPDTAAVHFDAEDAEAMTRAIDEVTSRTPRDPSPFQTPHLGRAVLSAAAAAL